jgi:hypothetical protein
MPARVPGDIFLGSNRLGLRFFHSRIGWLDWRIRSRSAGSISVGRFKPVEWDRPAKFGVAGF